MLAPDGRCKTFDARGRRLRARRRLRRGRAKRLSDAQRRRRPDPRGDPRHGRQPGRPQQRADGAERPGAGGGDPARRWPTRAWRPREVDYVEAHGTGTSLGDPIEVQALGAVLGAGRGADEPLLLGSVKTNIGHLEAAAGVAGLIKVVLALQHGEIPPHLHFQRAEPAHRLGATAGAGRRRERRRGPRSSGPRIAGVSSFGFSGTNAHVIVEEAPAGAGGAVRGAERPRAPADAVGEDRARACASWPRATPSIWARRRSSPGRRLLHGANRAARTSRSAWRWWPRRREQAAQTASRPWPRASRARRVYRWRPWRTPAQGRVPVHGAGLAVRGMGRQLYDDAADVSAGAASDARSCCGRIWSGRCWA